MSTLDRSAALYNPELAPESATNTWKTLNLFNWWMAGWHSMAGYTMAIGLFAFGLNGWQAIIAFIAGAIILYWANNLTGVAGQREKVPFPVFARAAFGVFGANIPAILRAIVAVFWYGIQTYLASAAVMILVMKIAPGTAGLAEGTFLGLSGLGWICFLLLSALQWAVLLSGLETVRRLTDFAGPTIWVAVLALAVWMLYRAGWTIDLSAVTTAEVPSGARQVLGIASAAFIVAAYMAGPSLNFADFTRNAPSESSVRRGNALGLLINASLFGIVSVVIALAAAEVYGDATHDLVHLVADIDNVTVLLVTIIAVAIATAGVNIICNFVAPVYDLINIRPGLFTFRRAGTLVAVLAVVVTPWNLFSSPVIVNQLIGGIGAFMGPLFGIITVDYYLLRRKHLDTESLFTDRPDGLYFYRGGYNPRAIAALAIGGFVALLLTFLPAWADAVPFAWPAGILVGGLAYWLLHTGRTVRIVPDGQEQPAAAAASAEAPATTR